jgi:glycogen operon protein
MAVAVENDMWTATVEIPQKRNRQSSHETRGRPFLIGATVIQDGVNFSVFSRESEPELQRTSLNQLLANARTAWHGVKLEQPDWGDWSHSLAFGAEIEKEKLLFHMITNAFWDALEFELPTIRDGSESGWRRWIDTGLDSPQDIVDWQAAPAVPGDNYRVEPRSVVVLFVRLDK